MTYDPNGRNVQPSDLHPSPGFHRRELQPIVLGRIIWSGDFDPSGDAEFVVTTPEIRTRVRLEIIFCPDPGTIPNPNDPQIFWGWASNRQNLFAGHTLWLTKRSNPELHGWGEVNVENLVGDIWQGEPIPMPGCLGYHIEAETTADEIWGRLHIGGVGQQVTQLPAGTWILRVSADAVHPMEKDEWDRLVSRFARRSLVGANVSNQGRQ